ncbi:peptide-methionine (S)-S-oxide reductase MsrA [Kordiimonas aquimaris]|uniref:peptide-methionine (S)-S-oxide reductase MsrA n=1 Tax=Kordiimonas aquimaris TaxID=707591 RepID=UPI0021D1655B|nr:peptide-methionine (S)-S-oxide reductase MsrA [Kordiimonas aquimaris]
MAKATFGAGCFWGVEETFRVLDGVTETTVGYMGGTTDDPTYEDVCSKTTGHAEVVQVEYNPEIIDYAGLVDVFFENHNPTQLNRQGPDVGTQYRSAIFFADENQKEIAQSKIVALDASKRFGKPIVTTLEPLGNYWLAEEYHQKFLAKRGLTSCHI